MSKSLFTIFVSCFLVFAFAWNAHSRPGEKGIFEAPMVYAPDATCDDTNGDGECDGSEGKVERNGDWKVEINGVETTEAYVICIEHDGFDSAQPFVVLAAGILPDEDGELKATEADGIPVPNDTYVNPRLVVRADVADSCSGEMYFTSGFGLANM